MRDRMERFVLLPFSIGCVSESSIAVAVHQHQQSRRSKPVPSADHDHKSTSAIRNREEDEESLSSNESTKSSVRFPKPDISTGIHRLFKSFKSVSQLFVYKEDEELEDDIEIGFPTDVKHVTHIGIDGSSTTNNQMRGWGDLISPEHLLPHLPSVSLEQFELSMAAQTQPNLTKNYST